MELDQLSFADLIALKNEIKKEVIEFRIQFESIEVPLEDIVDYYNKGKLSFSKEINPNKHYLYSNIEKDCLNINPELFIIIFGENPFYELYFFLKDYIENRDRYYTLLDFIEEKTDDLFNEENLGLSKHRGKYKNVIIKEMVNDIIENQGLGITEAIRKVAEITNDSFANINNLYYHNGKRKKKKS